MTHFDNVLERLPNLVDDLTKIRTQYAYENKYIGEACGYLLLLQDLLIQSKDAK